MAGSTVRRVGALLAAGTLAISLGTAEIANSAVDRADGEVDRRATDLCSSQGPIQAADLAAGMATANCSLVGRLVVAGAAAVVVPPDGYGVGGDGVAAAGGADAPSLEVQNIGGVVTASVDGGLSPGRATKAVQARDVAACNDAHFTLENGGHAWVKTMKWHYRLSSTPTRFAKFAALAQIKAGLTNMRSGHNDCGLTGKPRATSKYVGDANTGPNINVGGGQVTCGRFNQYNVVGWGSLPNGLLGWTCFWWAASQHIVGADMRISPSTDVVLNYPQTCNFKFDLQSLTTHEWGHAWGLGHVANSNLTMHHFLPACSTAFRTLGLGDWRGMRKLYGVR